ncbi:MAG: ATP-binding protein [Bacteroidales bacterium]|jgi:AAA15 family ATPase/GTPase|nr:ATP-binding protein [Bacteroidales bacterium]
MILELKIKNFLSFKEEVTFSFEATRDASFEDYQVVEVVPNIRILRLAIVYGANASGKSNLIDAFEFLRYFWFNHSDNKDKPTGVTPFLLDRKTPQEPSEFSLTFYIDGVKYLYSLVLNKKTVFSEKLFIYPETQPAMIFDRVLNENGASEIVFNPMRVKINQTAKDEITIKCLANMSVWAAYNQVNVAVPDMENVIKWMKSQYNLPSIEPHTGLVNYAEHVINKDESMKNVILNFLRRADFNITDVNTEIIRESVSEEVVQAILNDIADISSEEKERLKQEKTVSRTKTEFEHRIVNNENREEFYTLLKKRQSKGTLRTFGLASVICKTIAANAFLAIDEIESSLHPRLVEFFIEDFLKQKSQSQLLLTTHYDGLLEEDDLLRKDSIWFTNKKTNGSTELYSLADFKGIDRISSLQKAYKYGKFGAIPNI